MFHKTDDQLDMQSLHRVQEGSILPCSDVGRARRSGEIHHAGGLRRSRKLTRTSEPQGARPVLAPLETHASPAPVFRVSQRITLSTWILVSENGADGATP